MRGGVWGGEGPGWRFLACFEGFLGGGRLSENVRMSWIVGPWLRAQERRVAQHRSPSGQGLRWHDLGATPPSNLIRISKLLGA